MAPDPRKKMKKKGSPQPQVGNHKMSVLCGFGYWVQGFRCFPWLALNFHMANYLNLNPSTLQLVQNSANFPMVAKPLYGLLSDAIYFGSAHRIPYIVIGVLMQMLCWGSLGLIPIAGTLPTLMACILLSNFGASITEVAMDALVAEYGKKNKISGLQSYAFMASTVGAILGNLLGGFLLQDPHQIKTMFLVFAALLNLQLAVSLATREGSLGLPLHKDNNPISVSIKKQYSELMVAIKDRRISHPLIWIVGSFATVPILSGSIFCYQTQSLNLDPSIIGMSRVTSQLVLLSLAVLYERFWKRISLRKLVAIVQILYAFSLLLDLVLVKQINLKLGISNEAFVLCFSGIAETVMMFKVLPFQVLLASLAPPGCEGSLTSFFASVLCLSSIFSGFFGVGMASFLGIKSGDFSSLPVGIMIQFVSAFVPLLCICYLPMSQPSTDKTDKEKKKE